MKKIRILLIEDNRLLREGLTALFKKQSDMNVFQTDGNNEIILKIMSQKKPQVILLDLGLRNRSSLNLVKFVKKKFPKIKVIVMDLIPAESDVFKFVQAGVAGFILKDAAVNDFLNTIRSVANGSKILPPNLTGSLFSQIVEQAINMSKPSTLIDSVRMTKRESQVIELISEGYSNKEIAQELHLSTYTIKSHVHNILEKLALRTRFQIAKYLRDSQEVNSAVNVFSIFDE